MNYLPKTHARVTATDNGPLITRRCQMACAQGKLIKIKITFVCLHTVLTGKCAGSMLDDWRPESICVKAAGTGIAFVI